MPEYRAYIIGPDRHFFSSVPLECADDAEATKQAVQLVDRQDVELWQRARKVVGLDTSKKSNFEQFWNVPVLSGG